MDLLEFLQTEESREILTDLTIAERIKYATAFQWARENEKPTPEEARAAAKQKCSEDAIAKRHEEGNTSFESELAGISAIQKIAGLTNEQQKQLEDEVFTKGSISDELKETIKKVFQERETENSIIDALCMIHDNWMKNHGDNFQKAGRDKDYQFVDLQLMPFGDDGATADLIFLRPILEECGIEIDMGKLEQRFNERQEQFIRENHLLSQEDLIQYLTSGSARNKVLEGLKAGDGTGRTIDEILRENPLVVMHMAEQVMRKLPEQSRIIIDEHTSQLMEEQEGPTDETVETIRNNILSGNSDNSEYGIITIVRNNNMFFDEKERIIGNELEFRLSREYDIPYKIGHDWEIHSKDHHMYQESFFSKADEDTEIELREKISARQRRLELLRKKVEEHPGEYMVQGQIEVKGKAIPMTQKELIDAGLDPDLLGWRSLTQVKSAEIGEQAIVTANAIARATKELPKRAIDGVRSLFSRGNDERQKGE